EQPGIERPEVRRLQPDPAVGGEQARGLPHHRDRVGHVLDQVEHQDQIEALVRLELLDRPSEALQPTRARRVDAGGIRVDDKGARGAAGAYERRGNLALSATNVEDAWRAHP